MSTQNTKTKTNNFTLKNNFMATSPINISGITNQTNISQGAKTNDINIATVVNSILSVDLPAKLNIASNISAGTVGNANSTLQLTYNSQGELTTASQIAIAILTSAITDAGNANGAATLDDSGKILLSQLPASIISAQKYLGQYTFGAIPALPNTSGKNNGDTYILTNSATIAGITYNQYGALIYNGTTSSWDTIDPINITLTQSITSGNITQAPSSDAVYSSLQNISSDNVQYQGDSNLTSVLNNLFASTTSQDSRITTNTNNITSIQANSQVTNINVTSFTMFANRIYSYINSATGTINLPSSTDAVPFQVYSLTNNSVSAVTLSGNGSLIGYGSGSMTSYTLNPGSSAKYYYDTTKICWLPVA